MNRHEAQTTGSDRGLLVALAVCCAGPMLLIVVLTSVAGIALGPATAVSLGLVASGVCVAVMVQRHRGHQRRASSVAGARAAHGRDHSGG